MKGENSGTQIYFLQCSLILFPFISVALDQALLLISVPFSFPGNVLFLASLFFRDLAWRVHFEYELL